jgi:hypothetical protein
VAALAIVPLAALIVHSTEQVAEHTGPAVGGLLNATFGNLPELIFCVVALRPRRDGAGLPRGARSWPTCCWRWAWPSSSAAGAADQRAQALSDQGMIIQQQHPDRGGRAPSPRLAHTVSMRASGVPAGRIGASSIMIGARDSVAWP